ncbi:MAG: hypothetical protein N2652_09030 [Kiritimatiellae bacterium]|nr:hypothetical protein [Kiritimatiellia bacterium]
MSGVVVLAWVALVPVLAAAAAERAHPALAQLLADGAPLRNLHVHLKGGLTVERALELSRATGVQFGLAINVGLGFPTTNDAAALAWLAEVRRCGEFFAAVQGEGREWTALLSPETVAQFDYVFTDAMTWTDRRGRRLRLWIAAEAPVDDPEEFMDMLVERTVGIVEREPIDVLANPTFLPASLAARYDELWTEARMRRVIEAAVRYDVALEINARTRLPGRAFLRLARAAGAKFAFGTNNRDEDVGDLGYCLDVAHELGLGPADLFVPRPAGQRAADRRRHLFPAVRRAAGRG